MKNSGETGDCCEFEASLGYKICSCFKNQNTKPKKSNQTSTQKSF